MLPKLLRPAMRNPVAAGSSSHSTHTQHLWLKAAVLQVRTGLSSLLVWLLLCQLVLPMHYGGVRAEVTHNVAKSLVPVQANAITVFGPRRFVRTTGQLNQYGELFSLPAGFSSPSSCTLQLQNGGVDGSQRVSSATVKHNGTAIFTPGDLNQNVGSLNRTIFLTSNNQLDVTLSSKTGSYLTITITCSVSDTTLPAVVITDPTNNTTTTASEITISGTANDPGAGASGIAHVYVNDVEALYNVSAGTWILTNLPLIIGANQVTARALDQAGNQATATLTITRSVADTTLPSVVITDPPTNINTTASQITISGNANDTGAWASGIAHVYVNDVEALYNASDGTWRMTNLPLVLGVNHITARALDQAGNQATATVTITRETPNQPPSVDAGMDQTLTTPHTATLDGTAADDGLPQGSSLNTFWSVVNGPGNVTFSNASDVDTTATFSSTGVYVLRLTASDSEFTVSDDIQITVPTLCQAGDNFDDNVIDLAKWIQPGSSPVIVEEKNQRLEISPSRSATGYNGYVSAISCDLTNRQVSVEVVQTTSNVCGPETYFTLRDASNPRNLIFVVTSCDVVGFFYFVNGASSVVTRIYDPAQYRFWRISHNGATNTISWETSPDRLTWTVQRSLVSQFPLSNMITELQAGTYMVVNPGKAIFDDLRYEDFSAAATASIGVTSPANRATFFSPASFQISTKSTAAAKPKKQSRFVCKL